MADTRRISISPDTLINLVEEESVVLDLKSEQYFGLNRSATRMWSALAETGSVDGAYEKLLGELAVDPDRLRSDLEMLVAKLVERKLMQIDAA
jgi:hypothetical protein